MTSSDAAPVAAPPPIDLTDDLIKSEREISGEIVVDESIQGDYGPQWHFAFKPLEYTLNTKTGAYHEYVPTDKRGPRTKFGIIVSSLMLTMKDNRPKSIGSGEMIGRQCMFLEKDFKFGKDKDTQEDIVRTFLLFLREFTDEDKQRIAEAGSVVASMPSASSMSDEDVEAILSLIDGTKEGNVTAVAARSKLSQGLKAAVLSGSAVPALIAAGKILVDGTGVLRRPAIVA